MATWLCSQVLTLSFSFLLVFLLSPQCYAGILRTCQFDAIYQLGDSVADTGNFIREYPLSSFARLPYGRTFFNHATGRCSNGLLMIDYIALSAGIPFLDPYLNSDALFTHGRGVNFAVTGATALPVEILNENGIFAPTNTSLTVQLDWMFTYFNGICRDDQDCFRKLKTALFIVGEIGVNDYNYALNEGKSFEEVGYLMPKVIQAIKEAVTRVIGYGATRVVVPGNFPTGCFPIYLTQFQTNDSNAYDDEFQCLKGFNNLSIQHNNLVKKAIRQLRNDFPNVIILYGDYYNAYLQLLRKFKQLGFEDKSTHSACCGIGGDYNFNSSRMCGASGVAVCSNPDEYVSFFFYFELYLFIALLVYVDDIIIASNDLTEILKIKQHLHELFSIKDLRELKYFLGLEVARSKAGINICQKKYTLDLLKDLDFLDSKPTPTPILPETRLTKDAGVPLEDTTTYRKLIGKLQYLTTTRPDISFAVQQLAQFRSVHRFESVPL
ncbi:Lipase, GDSL [Corchorus capsularis]|uniref:Lipase, GDSL n=1 Tax=Corchorus capsularis TaxID=210143 RepID=A0A1R3JI88_COCAP|nr:Lipase, GDSL [Corchorus capsularis]